MKGKFGLEKNPCQNLWANHKIWPITVMDITQGIPAIRRYKQIIGDQGEFRENCDSNIGYMTFWSKTQKNNVSIFNPVTLAYILKLYGTPGQDKDGNPTPPEIPAGGNIYDPFGGGGTRALVCASNGYNYVGVEIREEEVQGLRGRLGDYPYPLTGTARIIHGDARATDVAENWADAIITCPPYYNLEPYDGGENDISMLPTYDSFLNALDDVVVDCRRILKPGGLAFWVVGLHRNPDTIELYPINHDLSNIHREHGWLFREEVILHRRQTSAPSRVGMFAKGNHLLIRIHEYLLIYRNDKDAY